MKKDKNCCKYEIMAQEWVKQCKSCLTIFNIIQTPRCPECSLCPYCKTYPQSLFKKEINLINPKDLTNDQSSN